MEELLNVLILDEKKNYKCFDLLKELINNNPEFRETLIEGVKEGKIIGFDIDIWNKIYNQNIRFIDNFETVFEGGYNIGGCTTTAKQLSYSLDRCYICGGDLPLIAGTKNSPDGRHTWLEWKNYLIDTSLMLFIDKTFAPRFGYIETNKNNPMLDPYYRVAKDYTNDPDLNKDKKRKSV